MTLNEVLDYFEKNYPNANVMKLPEDSPLEIICEIDPTSAHPSYSVAISAISSSRKHHHAIAMEEYEVLSGTVLIEVDGAIQTLYEHEKISIPAGKIHSATSTENYALVKVTSQPGWTEQDHILD